MAQRIVEMSHVVFGIDCIRHTAVDTQYSSLLLSRTRLPWTSRNLDHTSVSLRSDLYFSVIYYRVSRTRLFRIHIYLEHFFFPLWYKLTLFITNKY